MPYFTWIGWDSVFEVMIKTFIVFVLLFILMRLRGKRQLMQLSLFDVIIIIALGSAVGDAMIYPESEVPFLRSIVAIVSVMFLVILLENLLAIVPQKIFVFVEGESSILIRDGEIDRKALGKENINIEELKTLLREKNVHSFSEVKLAQLEPDGQLTVTRRRKKEQDHKN